VASSVSTGAVYGNGVYGTAIYGQSNIFISVDGVASTASAGALSVTADSNTQLSVSLIGYLITDAPGVIGDEVVIIGDANTSVTGVSGTSQIGTVAVSHNARPTFTGVESTVSQGTISLSTTNRIVPDGIEMVMPVDSVDSFEGDIQAAAVVDTVVGVEATTTNGGVTQRTENTIFVTGLEVTGSVDAGSTILNNAQPTFDSAVATISVGTPTIVGDCNTSVTGVEGTGAAGDGFTFIGKAVVTPLTVFGQMNINAVTVSAAKNPIVAANRDPDRVAIVPPEEPRIVYVKAA